MRVATLALLALLLLDPFRPARASIIYGALGNFDCINDTGQTAHGFEIELDGVRRSSIFATFGAPYNRYGTPTITTVGGNTFVRWESAYVHGAWAVGTASGTYGPTTGHSLFFPQYGGDPNYPNVPGDHFGVALNVTPTNTVYHWLLDGGHGTLVRAGTALALPAPVLSVVPPANAGNAAGVQAVVQAPAPENGQQMGDAIWVKVYTTVVENPGPIKLADLVVGNKNVPGESETEIEWQLLQKDPNKPGNNEKIDNGDLAHGKEAVIRRYEFFAYTGGYDPENHEALHDSYNAAYVGAFLGNQNVAANFAPTPEPSTLGMSGLGALGVALGAYVRRRRSQRG